MEKELIIGIGYTVRNRLQVAFNSINKLKETLPISYETNIDFRIAIVDDASEPMEFGLANYRFNENVGVCVAKNKCLELLRDCDYYFMFDDDCYPIKQNWWLPYIESGLEHACYTFNRKVLGIHKKYAEFEKPNGCMLFFTRKCIDVAGGWDLDFKGYGFEHVSLSDRIYNLGLTPARYIDIPCQGYQLFEMADCASSFSHADRAQIPTNYKLYQQKFYSKEFKEFR